MSIEIDKHTLKLSNLDKVLFPKSNITKGDLIDYYKEISSLALPFYENRPLTMQRCPEGIHKQCFLQKGASDYFPEWIERIKVPKKEGHISQALVNNAATLVYLVDQACITFHLTLSKIDKLQYPDYIIFDLDPSIENLPLLKQSVRYVKDLLDTLNLKGFIKTTGSRGFHIYLPIRRDAPFTQTHEFAKKCASYLTHKFPDELTIEQSKVKRGNRVFIDYVRNSYGATVVAPYSVRALENAPIATPIHWDELDDKDLTSQTYTLKNIFKRLAQIKDPWADINKYQFSLNTAQQRLNEIN